MFGLDTIVLAKITGLISSFNAYCGTTKALFDLIGILAIGGIGSKALSEFIKIKRGDYTNDVPKRKRQ